MSESIESFLAAAEVSLKSAQALVAQEISAYPTPISGCDAQFNHLLAERTRIGRALDALTADVFVPTPRSPSRFAGVESR